MNIYIKTCKKCGKKYDMMSCPYCNEKRIKERGRKNGRKT